MRALFLLSLVLAIAGCATPATTADGLVSESSGKFDELYLRPNADLSAYRRVLIEPVAVKFRGDYLSQQHGSNYLLAQPRYRPYRDAEDVAQDFSQLMEASLADAFRAASCEVVGTAEPGVLRIAATIDELFINAPDRLSSSVRVTLNRDAGQATLLLQATDAVSGSVLARVVRRNIVREVNRLNVSDDSSNRFWFETAFRRWAKDVAGEFGRSQRAALSLAQ